MRQLCFCVECKIKSGVENRIEGVIGTNWTWLIAIVVFEELLLGYCLYCYLLLLRWSSDEADGK